MKFDKTIFKKNSFQEADNQKEYWKSKSFEERLEASLLMTRIAYGLVNKTITRMDKSFFLKKTHHGKHI